MASVRPLFFFPHSGSGLYLTTKKLRAWGCDSCERRITSCRILCIQCISDDLSDNIDLCAACVDTAPTKRHFTHDVSHAVLKVENTLHDHELARTVNAAKLTIERIKTIFRREDSIPKRTEEKNTALHKDFSKSGPCCACCEKKVLLPCWVCVICCTLFSPIRDKNVYN